MTQHDRRRCCPHAYSDANPLPAGPQEAAPASELVRMVVARACVASAQIHMQASRPGQAQELLHLAAGFDKSALPNGYVPTQQPEQR